MSLWFFLPTARLRNLWWPEVCFKAIISKELFWVSQVTMISWENWSPVAFNYPWMFLWNWYGTHANSPFYFNTGEQTLREDTWLFYWVCLSLPLPSENSGFKLLNFDKTRWLFYAYIFIYSLLTILMMISSSWQLNECLDQANRMVQM